MFTNLKQHHIGCLVDRIDDFINDNSNTWPQYTYSTVYDITAQDVRVCFLNAGEGTTIELVEPGVNNRPLKKLLDKGVSYYHIGFITNRYEESARKFQEANCHLISEFFSEAFSGKRCSFYYHPQLKLIELIEGD